MKKYWRAAAVITTVLCAVAWAAPPATAGSWNLHRGSKGAKVRTLEVRLNQLHLLPRKQVDRRYRAPTVRAVKRFQRQMGLRANGRVNMRTWNLIYREVVRRNKPKPKPKPPPTPRVVAPAPPPVILGHRGARVANVPENTMASMRYAALTADIIEFDLQLTADGQFVLMHDSTLDRTTNCAGRVADWELAQIQALCLTDIGTQRVPSFTEAVEYAAGIGKPIAPEVKDSGLNNARLTDEHLGGLVTTLQVNDMVSRTFVQSFFPALFPRLRALEGRLTFVFLVSSSATPASVRASGATIAGPNQSGLTAARVAAFRAAGLAVWAWTAASQTQLKSLWDMRVDGVITDVPATARQLYH